MVCGKRGRPAGKCLERELLRENVPIHTAQQCRFFQIIASPLQVLFPALLPAAFERHRHLAVAASRLALFAAPLITNPRGMLHVFQVRGLCQVAWHASRANDAVALRAHCREHHRGEHSVAAGADVALPEPSPMALQVEPSPHWAGSLRDLWVLMLGTRGLAMLLTPITLPLPLVPHMALAVFAVQRCRTAAYACSCPMLRHPTWQRRIARLHNAVRKVSCCVGPRGRWHVACGAGGLSFSQQAALSRVCRQRQLLAALAGPQSLACSCRCWCQTSHPAVHRQSQQWRR